MMKRFKYAKTQVLVAALFLIVGCSEVIVFPADAILPDGGVYRGDIKDGLFHGDGELNYPDGASYKGQFEKGLLSGKGVYKLADGSSYQGDFLAGAATGNTVYRTRSGDTEYRGEIVAWVFNGVGRFTDSESTYVGEFKDGNYHGKGKIDYQEGMSYTGEFKDSLFHGQGVYRYNGITYEGEFANGELNGQGTITSEDGSVYIGEVVSWLADGKGQKTDVEGNLIIGTFKAGYAQGEGRFVGKNGQKYQGSFAYDEFDGQGKLTLVDQSVYIGEFSYGRYDGEGELRVPASSESPQTVTKGRWRNGQLVYNSETGEHLAAQAEVALEQHQLLLEKAISDLQAENSDRANAYFLGVAGDGTQSVFRREIEFVSEQLNQRFATQKRSIKLVNHHDSAGVYPLATTRSFATAVEGIANHMNKERDVLFVYFTSHGSKEHALTLDHDSINFPPLTAKAVGEAFRSAGIKWKVVFVSACYAGGFIPELDDGNTLIMTAADSQSTSFGCSEESTMTYFGKALFKEVLAKDENISLPNAFVDAAKVIEQWESEQDLTSSNPQIQKSKAIVRHLEALNVKK